MTRAAGGPPAVDDPTRVVATRTRLDRDDLNRMLGFGVGTIALLLFDLEPVARIVAVAGSMFGLLAASTRVLRRVPSSSVDVAVLDIALATVIAGAALTHPIGLVPVLVFTFVVVTRRVVLAWGFRLIAVASSAGVGVAVWLLVHQGRSSPIPPSYGFALVGIAIVSVLFEWIDGLRRQVRLASASLSVRDAQLGALIHAMPVALLVVDPNGVVAWTGGSLLADLGLAGIEGKNAFDSLTRAPGATGVLTAGLCGQESERTVEVGGRAVRLSSAPWSPGGRLSGALLVALDITTEAERQKTLEQTIEEKDRFISSLSHELMTPLTAVMGFAQVVGPDGDESLWKIATNEIWRESARMAFIIDNLMVFGRLRMTRLTTRCEPVRLDDIVDDAIARMPWVDTPVARVKDESVWASTDGSRARIVVQNLVVNAIAHGGDRVEAEVGRTGQRAWVEIRDDGPPIDDSDSMFVAYNRRQAGTTPAGLGTGLSVSRSLARQMDGEVVYRHEGGWSRFRFEIPVATADVEALTA